MTSILSSLFQSASTQLANRIDSFRATEATILSYARRFHADTSEDTHIITVYDTKIPNLSSLLNIDEASACPLNSIFTACDGKSLQDKSDEEKDSLIMHAYRIESKQRYPSSNSSGNTPPLVLLHGYANSSLNYYRNVLGLANFFPSVYSVDLLGWGLSSRPPLPNKPLEGKDEVQTTESFFVESLESWRKANQLDKMVLGGHSMGGYLSIAYAEAYPQYVERLILISPVGIPREEDVSEKIKALPWKTRLMIGFFQSLWKSGATPSSVLARVHHERGKRLTSQYVENRLIYVNSEDEKEALRDYLYYNNVLPSSGEQCLSKLLKPMAFAKKPAIERVPYLKVPHVSFLYGEHDWMDFRGGLECKQRCHQLQLEGHDQVPQISVLGVRNAGHMLMIDNWKEFNIAMIMAAGIVNELTIPLNEPKPHVSVHGKEETFFQGTKFNRTVSAPASKNEPSPPQVIAEGS